MFGRSSFGVSQPNSFGFGSGASTSFGQPNQLFGGSNNSFGSGSSGFGSTSQTIFGNPAQSTAPLFGSSATPAFGQTNQSSGFGSSLFGSSQQPSGSGGIFGSSASTSFGQQNKPGGFGFPSSSSGGLFGQNTQNQQNAGSMFQGSPSSGLFGSSSSFGGGQAQTGTVNKFIPVTGTDSVQKAGLVQSINTKHYCITCMKEYENKSLEELRWEDYQANRKGQQQSSFGGPSQPFGIASTNSGLFGQTENKPVFGQSSSSFGQPSFGLSSQTTPSSNMFGKSSAGFGNTTTTNSFVFGGTPTTAIFGSSSTTKPFATPSNPTLFGQTQPQQCNFGMNIFGQQNQPTSSNIFGKTPQQQGFNMGQSAFQFGAQPQNSNVFQNQKSGNTGFNIFGQPNTTTGAFAQPQQSSLAPFNNFSKPNQSSFSQLSFMGMPNSSFNNTSKSLFPSNNNLFTNNRSGFQPPPSGFNLQPQQPQQQPVSNMQPGGDVQPTEARPIMQPGDPYGYNPHLGSLTPMKQQGSSYATNPRELQKFLDVSQPVAIVSPPSSRIKMYPPTVKKSHLFDEGVDSATSEINLTLKSSAKRLIIRKNSNTSANREPSNTSLVSLESNAESEAISEPNLATFMSKGPPLFIAPPRLRKTIPFDEFSSPNLTPNESTTTLITEKSDASVLETDTAETENPTETTAHITQTTLSSQTSITDIFIKDADLASGDMCRRIEKLNPPPAIDTCGITLNRSDYYTIPPLEKLIEHKLGDGHCLIRGFTIGRVGYGNVSFPDLIDVANLNLDELVHFRYRELTIYPDDTKKPPQGQGLNRRAQVTLDRVYPKAKVDKKIIVDAATLTAINFTDTLRELCDKHGTKFLDYRPETGSWVFMVEHFSKYKYSDSDSGDDDTEELDAQTRQKISTLAQQVRVTREAGVKQIQFLEKNQANKSPSHMERSIQELMIDDDDIMVEDAPMQVEAAIPVIEDDMTEIDESVTDEYQPIPSSSSLHQVRTRRELYKTTGHKFLLMKATLFEDDYVPVNIEKDNIETIGAKNKLFKDFSRYGVPPKATDEIEGRTSRTYILKHKPGTVPLNKSLYNSRNYMDMGLFKSRSFKVGWGKGMTLTTLSNGFVDVTDRTVRGRVHIFDVTRALVYDPLLESLPEHMRIVLETSDIELIDGIPFASVKPTKVAMKRHQALAERTFLTNPNKRTICYYKETWDLVHALWNDLSWDTNHREELSQWFRNVLAREVDEILQECYPSSVDLIYKEIFVHLTGCQLTEAAELAIRNCSPNLALLISQMNVNGDTKTILQYQMEQWNTTMALDFMPVAVQKIYMLLSGMLIYDYQSKQGTKRINVCEYLNWRQCLAIILWYMTSSADSIAAALYIYKEAYSKHTVCMKPFPEHLDENSDVLDLQYYLMLLHCDKSVSLEKILHPLTHNSYAGDYRLSWLLLQMLTALRVGVLNEDRRVALATSFSSQLESLGLPKWAVFPLLFIKDATIRKNQIMRTLHRNIDSNWSDLTEKDLVKQLLIPSEWIHEVMSYKTKLLKQHWQNYQHLSHSQMWNDAHKIAIEYIIPDLIINEKFDIIRNILVSLEKGQRYISNWRNQGGLLLAFFKVARECNRNEMARYEALNTHSALLDIITRLPFYPMETSKQIAAASELSKRCYIFATVLIRVIKPSYKGIAMVTSIELDKLTLPADYFFQALLNEMLRV